MEPRKIIKFGNSSYVITLPQVWIESNELKKGDMISVCEKENSLFLQVPKEKEKKKAVITYNKQPLKLLNKELLSFYLKNFGIIEIQGTNIIEKLEDIRRFKEKISSIEITEVSREKIVLKDLTSPRELNLLNLISEIIEMEKVFFEELMSNDIGEKISFISQLDLNINKLSFLAHKAINYHLDSLEDPNIVKGSICYWRIVGNLETIGDVIKRIARYLKNESDNDKKEIVSIIGTLKEYFCFITRLLNEEKTFDKSLEEYLDKKQSLLKEIENARYNSIENLNVFLVISQLLKDLIGNLDTFVISVIDLKLK